MPVRFMAQVIVDLRDYYPAIPFIAATLIWAIFLIYGLYMLVYFWSPKIRRWYGHGFDMLPPK